MDLPNAMIPILYKLRFPVAIVILLVCAGFTVLIGAHREPAKNKTFNITARQYAYDPPIIHVNDGDTVHIRLKSMDVVHGFYLEGYGIDVHIHPAVPVMRLQDPAAPGGFRPVDEIEFVASRTGKFRFRCSHTCGPLHPFMQGEMIVDPNYPLLAAVGTVIEAFCAAIVFAGITLSGRRRIGHE